MTGTATLAPGVTISITLPDGAQLSRRSFHPADIACTECGRQVQMGCVLTGDLVEHNTVPVHASRLAAWESAA